MKKPQKKNKDDKMLGVKVEINAIDTATDITKCRSIQEICKASVKDDHLQQLREHIIRSWSESRNEVPQEIRSYWTFTVMQQ